jgi:hypothetical protein
MFLPAMPTHSDAFVRKLEETAGCFCVHLHKMYFEHLYPNDDDRDEELQSVMREKHISVLRIVHYAQTPEEELRFLMFEAGEALGDLDHIIENEFPDISDAPRAQLRELTDMVQRAMCCPQQHAQVVSVEPAQPFRQLAEAMQAFRVSYPGLFSVDWAHLYSELEFERLTGDIKAAGLYVAAGGAMAEVIGLYVARCQVFWDKYFSHVVDVNMHAARVRLEAILPHIMACQLASV